MNYVVNGKDYSEFDINKRCAELLGFKVYVSEVYGQGSSKHIYASVKDPELGSYTLPKYCNNPSDTWPIIEKCWDDLNESILRSGGTRKSRWQDIMQKHNCSKLVAACICFVEVNDYE